jgi:DNA-binding transcriptional LysR family regulator
LYDKKKTGGIVLTDEGRVFLSRAHKVMRAVAALKTCANGATPTRATTRFAVGGTYALAAVLLPRLLAEFKKTHPVPHIVLRTGPSYSINDEVLRGGIEVGLVHNAPRSKRLNCEPYKKHPMVAFVHRTHAYARNGGLTLADFASAPLILRGGPRLKSSAEPVLKQLGFKLNIAVRCESLEAVRAAVRNKMGVGILCHENVKNAVQRGEFKLLRVPGLVMEAKSFIVYHKDRPLSPSAEDFLALLRKEKPGETNQQEFVRGEAMKPKATDRVGR